MKLACGFIPNSRKPFPIYLVSLAPVFGPTFGRATGELSVRRLCACLILSEVYRSRSCVKGLASDFDSSKGRHDVGIS